MQKTRNKLWFGETHEDAGIPALSRCDEMLTVQQFGPWIKKGAKIDGKMEPKWIKNQ